jgi:hypothetical protein
LILNLKLTAHIETNFITLNMKIKLIDEDNLTVSQKEWLVKEVLYTVHAICFFNNQMYFFISFIYRDDLYTINFFPSNWFEVIDNRLSRFWRLEFQPGYSEENPNIAYPEWVENNDFLASIYGEGNTINAREVASRYARLLYLEYRDPNITSEVVVLDKAINQLQCCKCSAIWNEEIKAEMVECPKCTTIQLWEVDQVYAVKIKKPSYTEVEIKKNQAFDYKQWHCEGRDWMKSLPKQNYEK